LSIFSTKILLATDGSEDAELAATTAVELANNTNSELLVVHVLPLPRIYAGAETASERESYIPEVGRREAQKLLDEQVRRIRDAEGTVSDAYL
jgi:nucleotide-binding universal stress UspA family protein